MVDAPNLTSLSDGDVALDADPAVIDLDGDAGGDVLSALSPETARALFSELQDDPTYPTALAEATGTSVQNVHYHVEKLQDAGLVEPVDTVYSSKGREMQVYAPTGDPMVFIASGDTDAQHLEATLTRLLGGLGVIALASILVQAVFEAVFYPGGPQVVDTGGAYASPPLTNVAPPIGLLVFLIGLVALACYTYYQYRRD